MFQIYYRSGLVSTFLDIFDFKLIQSNFNMAYNLLKGKKGIIFGALDENSIAWKTAERVHAEGGTFVLTNAPIAMRMGQINALAEKTGSQIVPADATNEDDLNNLIAKSMEILGGKLGFCFTFNWNVG